MSRTTPQSGHRRTPEYRRLSALQRITRKERAFHADELREIEAMTGHAEWWLRTFADALLDENRERWTRSPTTMTGCPCERIVPLTAERREQLHAAATAGIEALARRLERPGLAPDEIACALIHSAIKVATAGLMTRGELSTVLRGLTDRNNEPMPTGLPQSSRPRR